MMDGQVFRADDQNFPTTPALRERLAERGQLDTADAPAPRAPERPETEIPLGWTGTDDLGMDLEKLLAGRCLVQGSSGAGKSWLLRRIVEGAHAFVVTDILDPEGEFHNLAQFVGATTVVARDTTTDGLTAIALRARRHRISIHLDLTDLEPDTRITKAAAYLAGLVAAPPEDWADTRLIAIDEAHLLAPHMAATARDAEIRRLGVSTLTEVAARGRKRGLCPVIATQRLAKLSTSVLAELQNFLIGLNVLDRDVARAADLLGYGADKAGMLRDLQPGHFVALGPALSRTPVGIGVYPTRTEHIGSTPKLSPSAGLGAAEARELLGVDELQDLAPRPMAAGAGGKGARALDSFLLDRSGPAAARIAAALAPIAPNATTAADLVQHLGLQREEVDAALDLLSQVGAIDTMPRGAERVARLSARLRAKASETPVVGL